MANYKLSHTGAEIDEAVGKALAQTPISPITKTSDMTKEVGIDSNGNLFSQPDPLATHIAQGAMSSADKIKLDALNESHIKGLRVLCVGDSITAGQGMTTATRWANVMATQHNWTLTVQAAGGISMSNYYYRENDQTEAGIVSRIDYIAQMEQKPDLVIVWGGHNDTSYRHSPLGSFDDIPTTDNKGVLPTKADRYSFKGSIRYISEVVHTYAPQATLVILTREWTSLTPSKLQVPSGTADTNIMFDEAIREGADRYGYVCIPMGLCGITPFTKGNLTSDGVHPNDAGTRMIVKYLSSELNKIYYIYGIQTVSVTGVSLNKTSTSIRVGQTETLTATVTPQDATIKTVNWTSNNQSVATVNSSGEVTAVSNGNATITATTQDGGFTASCSVSCVTEVVSVTGVSLNTRSLSLTIGESYDLVATITPSNATNQNITWISSDDQTIDVLSNNGHITALNVGSGTVTVKTEDGNFTDTCSVTISPAQNYYVLEALNSQTHSEWTFSSLLGAQYFAFDGTNSIAQLQGKTISKLACGTNNSFSGTAFTVNLFDIDLSSGSTPPPSEWTAIDSHTFSGVTSEQKLEWTGLNITVQPNHTIGINSTSGAATFKDNGGSNLIGLETHYYDNAAATTSTAITINSYDFYVNAN